MADHYRLLTEDNIDLMNKYPTRYFDLGILDPQYGIKESSKNHKSRNTPIKQKNGKVLKASDRVYVSSDWDNSVPVDAFFIESKRVCKELIIFGANYFLFLMEPCKPPRRKDYQQFLKYHPIGYIIWDKVNGGNDFSDCEVIYTSFDFPSEVVYYMWNGMMQGISVAQGRTQQGNKKLNEKRWHPTQKSLVFMKWLLHRFVKPEFKVISTNLGSGNDAIVCHYLGVKEFVGTDIDADMIKIARDRFTTYLSTRKQIQLL